MTKASFWMASVPRDSLVVRFVRRFLEMANELDTFRHLTFVQRNLNENENEKQRVNLAGIEINLRFGGKIF